MRNKISIAVWLLAMAIGAPLGIKAIHARNVVRRQRECLNNLRVIDGAKFTLAGEKNLKPGAQTSVEAISPYMIGGWRNCPAGGRYAINGIGEDPTCSVPGHGFSKEVRPTPP
jgi:hypothetical protein